MLCTICKQRIKEFCASGQWSGSSTKLIKDLEAGVGTVGDGGFLCGECYQKFFACGVCGYRYLRVSGFPKELKRNMQERGTQICPQCLGRSPNPSRLYIKSTFNRCTINLRYLLTEVWGEEAE